MFYRFVDDIIRCIGKIIFECMIRFLLYDVWSKELMYKLVYVRGYLSFVVS